MTETVIADPDSGLTGAQLAARHGLRVAGARPSLAEYTRQLWSYRHFIAAHSRGRLVATFTKARLGQLWQVLTPLTNAAVYYLIFGMVLKTSRGIDNFIAYLCIGLFLFTFTQNAVIHGTQSITNNLGLIRALHFPRACLPLSVTLTQLQQLIASMVVLFGIILVTGEPLTMAWLLVVPVLLLQSLFNAGLVLALARLGSKITDLKQLMPFVTRTWMYASGVLYSVTRFTDLPGPAAEILQLNPLLVYIELARDALLASAPSAIPASRLWLLGVGWALLMAVGGYIYFWLGEKEYGRG
ncbi:MAG TPA: ABC transporter permease [Micromonospora sp.]|nr:ABC transporter permease [Micromonospora sp.]